MNLKDKVAIVTGAGGGGTGRATALRFAREGALVVVNDIDEFGGLDTLDLIESGGGQAAFYRADVADESDIAALLAFTESIFGGVDILVNNASNPAGLGQRTGWIECMNLELIGPMRATLAAVDLMKRRGGGAIVNIGSTSALGHGRKHSKWPSYDAAKMAMMRLTTTLAVLRDQDNIRVNCLVPSWIASPGPKEYWESLTPAEREERGVPATILSLDQVADAIHRLATDEALYGRIMVWWNGEPPRLIPVGDPGYERLE